MTTSITLDELLTDASTKENATMFNKQASLTDLWDASMQVSYANQNVIPTMEKMASYQPVAPEMQKSAQEVYLDEMCKCAAIDYHIEQEQEKQAGDYYGRLYGQSVFAGFSKAAEMDGVAITADDSSVVGVPQPGAVTQTVSVPQAGAGEAGWNYLNQSLPTKAVGQVGAANTFTSPTGLFGVPSAT